VYGYLGYPVAWMADRLGLDPAAYAAFVNGSGESFAQTLTLGIHSKQYSMNRYGFRIEPLFVPVAWKSRLVILIRYSAARSPGI
jgi:hypothetical protein